MVSIFIERKRVTILKGELVMIMSIDERKIGTACFIGGAIGTAVAFTVAPWLWFLGLLTGCAVGYLACEFGEVMAAIPIAARTTARGCGIVKSTCWEFAKWFAQPHPFLHQAIVFGLLSFSLVLWKSWFLSPSPGLGEKFFMLPVFAFFYPFMFAYGISYLLALLGAQRCARCYWDADFLEQPLTKFEERRLNKEYTKMPFTYQNVLRWEAKGVEFIIWHLFSFLLWYLWKWLGMGVVYAVKVAALFSWHLFKLIHSDRRSVSGMGSALGVVAAFLWAHYYFVPASFSLGEYVIVVFFGGCVGAVLGVVSWKLISVKCFGMPEYSPI